MSKLQNCMKCRELATISDRVSEFISSKYKLNSNIKSLLPQRFSTVEKSLTSKHDLKNEATISDGEGVSPKETTYQSAAHVLSNIRQRSDDAVRNIVNAEKGLVQKLNQVYQLSASKYSSSNKRKGVRKDFVSRVELEKRTQELVLSVKKAQSMQSQEKRLEELCKHLIKYPDFRALAIKDGILPVVLRLTKSQNIILKSLAHKGLAITGYVHPPKGRGIRILSIDGGGTKALASLEALRHIQRECKTEIGQLFDYVCGVSTGSLLAAVVFMYHIPLDECERIYRTFSSRMFTRNPILGTSQLVWNHAFYDTEEWESILRQHMGERLMIDSAQDINCPKISAISCIANAPRLTNFIFRNYNLPSNTLAQYPGNCKHKVWEVIRASSAAPGYYEQFQLGDIIHQDGGLLTNNPTALALHECKLLWPHESVQCVISLGNGQYEPDLEFTASSKISLKDKITKVVDSATDTEAVHTILQDLMPPSTYYRFNPYLSEDFPMDEIQPENWSIIKRDTQMYFRKNRLKLNRAASQLMKKRRWSQRTADIIQEKLSTYNII